MINRGSVSVRPVEWLAVRRIIRSLYPPIGLFEDIADPADWLLLISAEPKTNPRLMETIGLLDLVTGTRRVSGPGARYFTAPFTHVSFDRLSRFTNGVYCVLYAADRFKIALAETIHYHERFMTRTAELEGWTSQFREIVVDVNHEAHDLRGNPLLFGEALMPNSYAERQVLTADLRPAGGTASPTELPSARWRVCRIVLPVVAANPVQGRHLDCDWDGARVDLCREVGSGAVYRIEAAA